MALESSGSSATRDGRGGDGDSRDTTISHAFQIDNMPPPLYVQQQQQQQRQRKEGLPNPNYYEHKAAKTSPSRRNVRETRSPNVNDNGIETAIESNEMPTKKPRLEHQSVIGHDRIATNTAPTTIADAVTAGRDRERRREHNPNEDSPPTAPLQAAPVMLDHPGAEESPSSRHTATTTRGDIATASSGRPGAAVNVGPAGRNNSKGRGATPGKHETTARDRLSTVQHQQQLQRPLHASDPPEKRALRSSDTTSASARSELAVYFADYEQLLSLKPTKKGQSGGQEDWQGGEIGWAVTVIFRYCSTLLTSFLLLFFFFPSYDHLEALSIDTNIVIKDDLQEPITIDKINSGEVAKTPSFLPYQQPEFLNPLLNLCNARIVDPHASPSPSDSSPEHRSEQTESTVKATDDNEQNQDPLSDELYFKAHRRLERQEKRLRNIERDRAQHGKIQLDRLLNELHGHDWLRVMGITGIVTETERKLYEPKRAFFIREISALVEKYSEWKEEEKRRNAGKEHHHTAFVGFADPEDVESNQEAHGSAGHPQDATGESTGTGQGGGKQITNLVPRPPAATVQQSHPETVPSSKEPATRSKKPSVKLRFNLRGRKASSLPSESASVSTTAQTAEGQPPSPRPSPSKKRPTTTKPPPPPLPPPPPPPPNNNNNPLHIIPHNAQIPPPDETKPFRSFYANRHHRDVALGKIRRGRMRLAFGQPLVDFAADHDFELPKELLTPQAIRTAERRFRRARREMIADSRH